MDGNSAEMIANEEGNHECGRLVREYLDRAQQLQTECESQEIKFEEDEDFDIDDDTEENNFLILLKKSSNSGISGKMS